MYLNLDLNIPENIFFLAMLKIKIRLIPNFFVNHYSLKLFIVSLSVLIFSTFFIVFDCNID